MRALDYLETRKDVDCSKVGVCGTSGGGTMSAYLQALDPRIRVAFPNCYVSSIRSVFKERGCHDAEQFFWNQLNVGVNHAAQLAMGAGRVSLATGSRWKDYFPHAGAVGTFAVYSNLWSRIVSGRSGIGPYQPSTFNLQPSVPLRAAGWDCIAAAHAYAAEPQLFASVEFDNIPPSWTKLVTNPDPKDDSFAVGVWGALEEYDWTDLVEKE